MPRKKTASIPIEEDYEDEELLDSPAPITDNAIDVPLFADVDGRSTRSISQLRLYRLEAGGPPAYKGTIPLNSTLETIGQVFGDGIYTIEGINHKHTVLATKENIRISLARDNGQDARQLELLPNPNVEADRIERLARASANESNQNSRQFTELVMTTTQAAAQREREFLQAGVAQMSNYFSGMMSMQQQGFQQLMTMIQASHNMTIQSLHAAQPKKGAESNPMQFAELLMKGINIGRDFGDENGADKDGRPFWQDILSQGLGVLASTRQQEGVPSPNALPVPQLSARQRRALKEAVGLYKKVRAAGIDPDEFIARISEERESPSTEEEPTGPEDPDDDVLDDDESDDEIDTDEESEPEESSGTRAAYSG